MVRKRGEELLELVRRPARTNQASVVGAAASVTRRNGAGRQLLQIVRDVAAELEIGPEVLATRKDIEAIAFGSVAPADSTLLHGWRRQVIGEKLLSALTRA